MPWAVQKWLNQDVVWDAESGSPKEPRVRWGFRSLCGKGQYWGQVHAPTCPMTFWCELSTNGWTDQDILWSRLWTRVGLIKHYEMGIQIPMHRGNFGERSCLGMPDDSHKNICGNGVPTRSHSTTPQVVPSVAVYLFVSMKVWSCQHCPPTWRLLTLLTNIYDIFQSQRMSFVLSCYSVCS